MPPSAHEPLPDTRVKALWRCPKCGHRFVTKNLWHSCRWLDAGLWLRRRIEHPRVHRIEDFGRLGYGVHFRLNSPADIDARIVKLMREAYTAARAGA